MYTLRLHDLFRDCLDDRLRRESPSELPELLVRAAQSEGDPVRRMGYLLRAGDWQAAECELSGLTPELLVRGEISLVLRLWGQFPAEFRTSSPRLQLSRCITAWAQWDWPTMREAALESVDGFAAQGDEPMRQRALSYVCVAYSGNDEDERAQQHVDTLLALPLEQDTLCRTLLVASLFAQPRDLHRLAESWAGMVDALERMDSLQLWYECSPVPGYVGLPGTRQSMLRYVAGVQRRLPEQPIPLSGMTQVTQGWLHLWSARWPDVSDTLARAEAECRWLSQPNNLRWQLHMLRAMLLALQGDAAGACAAVRVLIDMARTLSGRHTSYLPRAVHYAQRIATIAGDEATLREMNQQLEAGRHDPRWAVPPGLRAAADAYTALADGRTADACAAWAQVLECEISVELYGQAVETRLRLASALAETHRLDDAARVLRPVLARLQDSAEFGMAATAGRRALEQLAGARWSTLLSADEQALLHRWVAAAQPLQRDLTTATTSSAMSTLSATHLQITPREFEVLQRIAAGDSNKLIARAFDLSPHAVKRHVANILDKLGVETRGQAAAHWRELQEL